MPDKLNLELKGLKLYSGRFATAASFHEAVTNEIVDQMVGALIKPRFLRLTAKWYVRGGLFTTVVAEHRKRGWKPAPRDAARHRSATDAGNRQRARLTPR